MDQHNLLDSIDRQERKRAANFVMTILVLPLPAITGWSCAHYPSSGAGLAHGAVVAFAASSMNPVFAWRFGVMMIIAAACCPIPQLAVYLASILAGFLAVGEIPWKPEDRHARALIPYCLARGTLLVIAMIIGSAVSSGYLASVNFIFTNDTMGLLGVIYLPLMFLITTDWIVMRLFAKRLRDNALSGRKL